VEKDAVVVNVVVFSIVIIVAILGLQFSYTLIYNSYLKCEELYSLWFSPMVSAEFSTCMSPNGVQNVMMRDSLH
jgi:hypothetical protein